MTFKLISAIIFKEKPRGFFKKPEKMKRIKKAFRYFKESKDELTKVVWPTRKHVINITVTVIILVIVVGIFLGFYDYFYSKLLTWFLTLKK